MGYSTLSRRHSCCFCCTSLAWKTWFLWKIEITDRIFYMVRNFLTWSKIRRRTFKMFLLMQYHQNWREVCWKCKKSDFSRKIRIFIIRRIFYGDRIFYMVQMFLTKSKICRRTFQFFVLLQYHQNWREVCGKWWKTWFFGEKSRSSKFVEYSTWSRIFWRNPKFAEEHLNFLFCCNIIKIAKNKGP